MGAKQSCAVFTDIWSQVEVFVSPRELVLQREVCKSVNESVEQKLGTVAFLRQILGETCRDPPTGKLLDAFLPGVRMLGPHSPNEAPAPLKCRLEVALGFECMSLDMLGFTVCGMGTAQEFCNNYLPVVWRLCVRGETAFTADDRRRFLLAARAIRVATMRLENGSKKLTVVRMGKGAEAHFDLVYQALILCINDADSDSCAGPSVPAACTAPRANPTPSPAPQVAMHAMSQAHQPSQHAVPQAAMPAQQTPPQVVVPQQQQQQQQHTLGHPGAGGHGMQQTPFVLVPSYAPQLLHTTGGNPYAQMHMHQPTPVMYVQQLPVTPPQHSLSLPVVQPQQGGGGGQPAHHVPHAPLQSLTLDPAAVPHAPSMQGGGAGSGMQVQSQGGYYGGGAVVAPVHHSYSQKVSVVPAVPAAAAPPAHDLQAQLQMFSLVCETSSSSLSPVLTPIM